jgi:flagellar biosynthesis chaperone FliJ
MVIIESVIKTNPLGRWYIELSDTMKEESMEICLDINEYAQKIEMMGEEYGGEVEIAWSSEENVSLAQINEVRQQIMVYEAEIEAKKQEATHMPDGTPDFSS